MKRLLHQSLASSIAIASTICAIAIPPTSTYASTLVNGWSYAADTTFDGSDSFGIGESSQFNFYGIGFKQIGDQILVAVNANLNIRGSDTGIGYGDLFFDFSPNTGYQTNDFEYGVRFAPNDNNLDGSKNGLYRNVTGEAVGLANFGYNSLSQYANAVTLSTQKTARTGDLAIDDPYYRDFGGAIATPTFNSPVPNVIKDGDFVSSISFLSTGELDAQGFNKASMGFNGTYTYGFQFAKPADFQGDFVASLFFECVNDSIALKGSAKPVPVPGLALGVMVTALFGGGQILRTKRKQFKAESRAV
jgi:hypothetical protein